MTGIGFAGIGALIGLFVGVSVVWEFAYRWRMPRKEQHIKQEIDTRYEQYRAEMIRDHAAEIGRLEQATRVAKERAAYEEREKIAACQTAKKSKAHADKIEQQLKNLRGWEGRKRHKARQESKKDI